MCGISTNPFRRFKNFYAFAKTYVDVRQRKINGNYINDYSKGKRSIIDDMKPYTIAYTQKEAGFKVETNEKILYVDIPSAIRKLIKKLSTDRVIEGKEHVILADTAVKLMSKTHQLYSGTVKFESCLLYTSPSPRDRTRSRMPSSA